MGVSEAGSQLIRKPGRKALGDVLSRKLWFLDAAALTARARARTGIHDFDDPAVEPALSTLTQSLEGQANLHPIGRFLMRMHLQGLLETRLRLADAWRKTGAELDQVPLRAPVFIVGMPRSGSTFLHELLAADPASRSPRVWEVMYPLPAPEPGRKKDFRVTKAATSLWWFRRLAPEADSVYPMRAETPHECAAIQSYTLLSEEFISTCRIPAYESFLHAADLRPVYRWQRRFLQHLQSRSPERRWMLKSPDHINALPSLFSAFPDAYVIQTHRNPLDVIKSSSHLTEVLSGLFTRPSQRGELGPHEAKVLAARMERIIKFRDDHPGLASRFIDVNYSELVADPIAMVRRIYKQIDADLPESTAARIQHLASHRSRYRRPRAVPALAELGLNFETEARRFDHYCSRFGVPCRQPGA